VVVKATLIADFPQNTIMIKVKHSGHIGDVIYSLPSVAAAAEEFQEKVTYYLHQDVIIGTDYDGGIPKPAISRKLAEFIKPLLDAQPYIDSCVIFDEGPNFHIPINCDLDQFRELPINHRFGHLPLHYMHLGGMFFDYAKPWLSVRGQDKNKHYKDRIIVGRSTRNYDTAIDYAALKPYVDAMEFIGTDEEYEAMRRALPKIKRLKVRDAYETACVIASSRLYIGNSSFNFAVAEGLKKNRLFEMNVQSQSLMPCGNVDYFTSTGQLLARIKSALA
jgi:hypothetical protein